MAEFSLWSKESLIALVEAQAKEIDHLNLVNRNLHIAWKNALREVVAHATVETSTKGTR